VTTKVIPTVDELIHRAYRAAGVIDATKWESIQESMKDFPKMRKVIDAAIKLGMHQAAEAFYMAEEMEDVE
jgi:hypothetical protein